MRKSITSINKLFVKFIAMLMLGSNLVSAQVSVNLPALTRLQGSAPEWINVTVGNLNGQNVRAFQFTLFYNKSVILIDSAVCGSMASGGLFDFNADTINQKIKVAFASVSTLTGSGTLVQLKVHYLNIGTSLLTFDSTFEFNAGTPAVNVTEGSIIVTVNTTAPALSLPANSSTGVSINPELVWNVSQGATTYNLQVSTSSTFATTIVNQTGITDTTYNVTGLSNNTQYYWRVSSTNSGGTSLYSTIFSFTTIITVPASPELVLPVNGATGISVTPALVWNKSNTASSYSLQVSTSSIFAATIVNQTGITDTTYNVTGLSNSTQYYWRVRAMNVTGWGAYSEWSTFTTIIDTPGVATLLYPGGNSNIPDTASSILFTWKSALLSDSYELQIASDNKFTTILADTTGITDTVFTYNSKNLTSTFYWRIRGSNIAGTGPWSPAMTVSLISGISNIKNGLPGAYKLYQNYPNPFNPTTVIMYALPGISNVKIIIYNLIGQTVEFLVNGVQDAGYHQVTWNASNKASGIYIYTIEVVPADGNGNFCSAKKLVLLK
jgi:hypothetical protein